MKVLHLPTQTGGNAWGLSQGERALGVESEVLYRKQDWLEYPSDIVLKYSNCKALELLYLIDATYRIWNKYDVYHFNFGTTLLDFPGLRLDLMDLPLYKNKKIVVTYNGCDARQKYKRILQTEICACRERDCYDGVCNNIKVDERKRRRINKFKKCNAIFCTVNPDLMRFLPEGSHFLPYTVAAWNELKELKYLPGKKLNIVHAPTNRVAKGTEKILKCLQKIIEEFPDKVEYTLVEKKTYREALNIYAKADLVIDQILIGWYGAFAVEIMKIGKPVIAYINEDDLIFLPEEMAADCKEALINANEENLMEVLKRCILDREYLLEKRRRQLRYVEKWHNPVYVAGLTKKIYEGVE